VELAWEQLWGTALLVRFASLRMRSDG
jgi:hypothetical protein